MRQFDEILRRGLMEANLAQYETVLDKLPDWEPDFSPRYRRERMRLLADPWNWVRRRARPLWKQIARAAACVVLACTLALGSLMAVSPTVRAAVIGWFRETFEGYTYYTGPAPDEIAEGEQTPVWRPTWVPEGWLLEDARQTGPHYDGAGVDLTASWTYVKGQETLNFHCYLRPSGSVGAAYGAAVNASSTLHKTTVQGYDADFYEGKPFHGYITNDLVWKNEQGTLFWLSGGLDQATLERIGESVAEAREALPDYRLGWVPEGAEERSGFGAAFPEFVQETWDILDQGGFDWAYSSYELSAPREAEEGVPEAVTVRGIPAEFLTEVPTQSLTMSIGSGEDSTTIELSGRPTSALLWTDPETGISFRITGYLEKEDFLKIAENITEAGG
ncbi:hypothetical protein [uncultured Oscillibacter sp.]|jgi:hypothetical protein|uniref:hypothetical protein n=1 Tax=uncultured Oscillibacter sp. TaxID=876091 RepID=UPI0025F2288D|nr:hypothetical protein [uncultured Oscillibacter sp.]